MSHSDATIVSVEVPNNGECEISFCATGGCHGSLLKEPGLDRASVAPVESNVVKLKVCPMAGTHDDAINSLSLPLENISLNLVKSEVPPHGSGSDGSALVIKNNTKTTGNLMLRHV